MRRRLRSALTCSHGTSFQRTYDTAFGAAAGVDTNSSRMSLRRHYRARARTKDACDESTPLRAERREKRTMSAGMHETDRCYTPTLNPSRSTELQTAYRCLTTPTCRQYSSTGQVEHFGRWPVHTCFPNGTSSRLISTQYSRGS